METLAEHRMPERISSHRRANKPLVEKRRRARINDSLSQLKSLLLQAMKQDSAQFSRLEKADILEMTVKYLRHTQKQHVAASMSNDPAVAHKYRAGFNECASEVLKYMQTSGSVKDQVKCSLGDHLAQCLTVVNQDTSPYTDCQRTPYTETQQPQTSAARACSVSPVKHQSDTCLSPLEIHIPESSDTMTSSPCKQTTPARLLLMPLAQSTPVAPVILVHEEPACFSSRTSTPDREVVANSFNDFKNITNIREYVRQTPGYPHCPVYPVARMPTNNRMFDSPPQCALKEDKVWRPW